jgi:hypothetical protein
MTLKIGIIKVGNSLKNGGELPERYTQQIEDYGLTIITY